MWLSDPADILRRVDGTLMLGLPRVRCQDWQVVNLLEKKQNFSFQRYIIWSHSQAR